MESRSQQQQQRRVLTSDVLALPLLNHIPPPPFTFEPPTTYETTSTLSDAQVNRNYSFTIDTMTGSQTPMLSSYPLPSAEDWERLAPLSNKISNEITVDFPISVSQHSTPESGGINIAIEEMRMSSGSSEEEKCLDKVWLRRDGRDSMIADHTPEDGIDMSGGNSMTSSSQAHVPFESGQQFPTLEYGATIDPKEVMGFSLDTSNEEELKEENDVDSNTTTEQPKRKRKAAIKKTKKSTNSKGKKASTDSLQEDLGPKPLKRTRGRVPKTYTDFDAPTEQRIYKTEGKTTKKKFPKSMVQRISIPEITDEQDEKAVLAGLAAKVEVKRRANTVAARKSRARKASYIRAVEQELESVMTLNLELSSQNEKLAKENEELRLRLLGSSSSEERDIGGMMDLDVEEHF